MSCCSRPSPPAPSLAYLLVRNHLALRLARQAYKDARDRLELVLDEGLQNRQGISSQDRRRPSLRWP